MAVTLLPHGLAGTDKREVPLSGDDVRVVEAFEALLERMGFQYHMWCKDCRAGWGNNQTTARKLVIECHCTRRVFDRVLQ